MIRIILALLCGSVGLATAQQCSFVAGKDYSGKYDISGRTRRYNANTAEQCCERLREDFCANGSSSGANAAAFLPHLNRCFLKRVTNCNVQPDDCREGACHEDTVLLYLGGTCSTSPSFAQLCGSGTPPSSLVAQPSSSSPNAQCNVFPGEDYFGQFDMLPGGRRVVVQTSSAQQCLEAVEADKRNFGANAANAATRIKDGRCFLKRVTSCDTPRTDCTAAGAPCASTNVLVYPGCCADSPTPTPVPQPSTSPQTCSQAWSKGPDLPVKLGEVAVGVIGNNIYVVGEGDTGTYVLENFRTWRRVADRPHPGDHHSAQVSGGKLYLFGGLGDGSERAVQVYTPSSNSWSTRARLPFDFGSGSTALYTTSSGPKVLACGGIAGSETHDLCATYDVRTNTWTQHGSVMTVGRNHAGFCVFNKRMLVIGGRNGGNVVGPAFDDAQTVSLTGSPSAGTFKKLPNPRAGVGNCVAHSGSVWVFGGEYNRQQLPSFRSETGANAGGAVAGILQFKNGVWKAKGSMPQAKHGIYPVVKDGVVYIIGGGIKAANSQSETVHFARLADIERLC